MKPGCWSVGPASSSPVPGTRLAAALAAALLLQGCVATPMGYLQDAAGPASRPIQGLAQGFTWICLGVVAVILVMIALAIVSGRRSAARDGSGVRRGAHGLGWIYWGVGISVPILIAMAVWNLMVTRAVAAPSSAQAGPVVEITAHRWWWEIRYQGEPADKQFTTANELVIPTGVPVRLNLTSADVIHDFWVPKLGPKMDMIPGMWNVNWLQADAPGRFVGQCAEFCGLEHAKMGIRVTALAPADYAAWLRHMRQPAVAGGGHGAMVFVQHCGSCHTVRGLPAGGIAGPELTHVGSRGTLAAGMLANTQAGRIRWIAHTQAVKPGAQMPDVPLDQADVVAVATFLGSLD